MCKLCSTVSIIADGGGIPNLEEWACGTEDCEVMFCTTCIYRSTGFCVDCGRACCFDCLEKAYCGVKGKYRCKNRHECYLFSLD